MRHGGNQHLGVPEFKEAPDLLLVCFKLIITDYLRNISKRWVQNFFLRTACALSVWMDWSGSWRALTLGLQNKAHLHDNCWAPLTLSFLLYQTEAMSRFNIIGNMVSTLNVWYAKSIILTTGTILYAYLICVQYL